MIRARFHPEARQELRQAADYFDNRRPGFKYMSIAYVIADETLWIVAIVHDRRRPGYWFHRLDDVPG